MCAKWRLKLNTTKTKIIHFRNKKTPVTNEEFLFGELKLEIVKIYKYLGIIFDEHLTFEECAKTLSKAAGRKLGHLFVINRKLEGIGYNTFTKLYESRVDPVAFYAATVWGTKNFKFHETIQNRAIRMFLGVSKYTTNLAIQGDMGWPSTSNKMKTCVCRFWNRLIKLPTSRLTKQIFLNDLKVRKCTWSSQALKILKTLYGEDTTLNDFMEGINLQQVKTKLNELDEENWKREIVKFPKLRTYRLFKTKFGKENYTQQFLSKNRRSLIAQMRTGTSNLRIETGRYERQRNQNGQLEILPAEKRLCKICESIEKVEDEYHFIFECEKYRSARAILAFNIEKLGKKYEKSTDLLGELLTEKILLKIMADYIDYAMEMRKTIEKKGGEPLPP